MTFLSLSLILTVSVLRDIQHVTPHLSHVAHGIFEVQLMEDIEDAVAVLPRRRLHQKPRHPVLFKMFPPSQREREELIATD